MIHHYHTMHGNSLVVFIAGLICLLVVQFIRGPVTYRRDGAGSVAGFCVGLLLIIRMLVRKSLRRIWTSTQRSRPNA
ncbi:hypothetical protein [Spirosoma knui]